MLNLTCTWHRINQKTLYNNIPWLLVTLTMSHILYICCYIASLGFFNAGIIHSWPATAIPSIRWKWTLKVIATTIVMKLCRISTQELSIDETSWLGSLASVGALIGTMVSWIVTRYLSARQVCRWGLGYLWHSAAGSVHLQCWHCHRLDSDFLCSSSVWQQTRQTIINSICRPVVCFWSILDSWCWASHVVFPTHCHLFTSQKLLDCPTKE